MLELLKKRTKVLDEVVEEMKLIEDKDSQDMKDAQELVLTLDDDYQSHWRNGYIWGAVAGVAGTYLIMKNKM